MAELQRCYTQNNPFGSGASDEITNLLLLGTDFISVEESRPVYIGDYGCADGGASLSTLDTVIDAIKKKYGGEKSVVVIYEDLISTDFNVIFHRVHGIKPRAETYASRCENVFPLATAIDIFSPCMPPNSMDMIFSSMTLHYLSKRPHFLSHALSAVTSDDGHELSAFAQQAEEDWTNFLLLRARELRKGGHLVVVAHEGKRRYPVYLLLDAEWKKMFKLSRISQKEYRAATMSFYHRSVEEFRKPFDSDVSRVRAAGLELLEIYTKDIPKPDYSVVEYVPDMAVRYALDVRRWSEDTLRAALSLARTDDDVNAILDDFYSAVNETILGDPMNFVEMNSFAFLLIRKTC